MWKIYKHTSPSGKVYIGQTIQDNPNVRWQNGGGYKSHNTIFYLAIKKYGWDNFKHEIIEDHILTQDEANAREAYWISFYDSYRNGYNSTPGGYCSGEMIANSKPVCQIDKKTGSLLQTFKSESDAERKTGIKGRNIAACCLKQGQHTAGGYYWCFQENINDFRTPKDKRFTPKRKVYCLEYDKVFDSLKEASEFVGIGVWGIEAVCNRRNQITAGGLHWCYEEDKDNLLLHINNFENKPRSENNKKMVIQIDKDTLKAINSFNSITDASKETKIMRQQIGKCASGKYLSAGGYYWCYKEDWDENWKPLLKEKTNAKKIICIETNEVFENLEKASTLTGANKTSISQVCNGKLLTAGGFHFCWLSTFIENGYAISKSKSKRSVVCIETKEIFESISEAAIKYHTFISNIVECCKHKQKTTKGLHFSYLENYGEDYEILPKRYMITRRVVCIETQKHYPSIKIASENTSILAQNISRSCRDNSKTAGGYHWKYED